VLGIHIQSVEVRSLADFDGAFETMTHQRAGALIVADATLTFIRRREIVDFASAHRIPGLYFSREFVEAGGLIAFGPNLRDMLSRVASYVDKILRGAKPADLPIAQPTQFDLMINLKTAKRLGLTIPQSVLLRADVVIQ
jgi:putative ABC transport system substrate-binding protein